MPLPELNTQGVDFGNTLLKLRTMQQQDEQNALLREGRNTQNALKLLEDKKHAAEQMRLDEKHKADMQKQRIQNAKDDIKFITSNPDPVTQREAFKKVKAVHEAEGTVGMPPEESFINEKGEWDTKKVQEYADKVNGLYDSEIGKTKEIEIKNPQYDPTKPKSITNPTMIKVQVVRTGLYNFEPVKGAEPTPIVDAFDKEDREAKRLKLDEIRTRVAQEAEGRLQSEQKTPTEKPKRSKWVHKKTGKPKFIDESNPKDRAFIETYGDQYSLISENPIVAVQREAINNPKPKTEKKSVGIVDAINNLLSTSTPKATPPAKPKTTAPTVESLPTKKKLPGGMTKEDWKAEAHRANPNMTGVQIEAEFNKRYTE